MVALCFCVCFLVKTVDTEVYVQQLGVDTDLFGLLSILVFIK